MIREIHTCTEYKKNGYLCDFVFLATHILNFIELLK